MHSEKSTRRPDFRPCYVPILFPTLLAGSAVAIASSGFMEAVEGTIARRLAGQLASSLGKKAANGAAKKIAANIVDKTSSFLVNQLTEFTVKTDLKQIFNLANGIILKASEESSFSAMYFFEQSNGVTGFNLPNFVYVTNNYDTPGPVYYKTETIAQGAAVEVSNAYFAAGIENIFKFSDVGETLKIDFLPGFSGIISNVAAGDTIDLNGVQSVSGVTLGANNGMNIHMQDGSDKIIPLPLAQVYSGDLFETSSDGNGGTNVTIATVSVSPTNLTINENVGTEQFTLTRTGDTSQATTVYASTTNGSTVAEQSVNAGDITPFVYQPVTFAAGASDATFNVGINDLGLTDGATKNFGVQVTDDQTNNNVLTQTGFSVMDNDPKVTYNYLGNAFNYQPYAGLPFFNGSLDASIEFDDLQDNFTGSVSTSKNNNKGPFVFSWEVSSNGESISNNNSHGSPVTTADFIFNFQDGIIKDWGIEVIGYAYTGHVYEYLSGDMQSDSTLNPSKYDMVDPPSHNARSASTSYGTWSKSDI